MDGSSLDLIIIPVVVVISLDTAWLVAVFWADSHPLWKAQRTAASDAKVNHPCSRAPAGARGPARRRPPAPLVRRRSLRRRTSCRITPASAPVRRARPRGTREAHHDGRAHARRRLPHYLIVRSPARSGS